MLSYIINQLISHQMSKREILNKESQSVSANSAIIPLSSGEMKGFLQNDKIIEIDKKVNELQKVINGDKKDRYNIGIVKEFSGFKYQLSDLTKKFSDIQKDVSDIKDELQKKIEPITQGFNSLESDVARLQNVTLKVEKITDENSSFFRKKFENVESEIMSLKKQVKSISIDMSQFREEIKNLMIQFLKNNSIEKKESILDNMALNQEEKMESQVQNDKKNDKKKRTMKINSRQLMRLGVSGKIQNTTRLGSGRPFTRIYKPENISTLESRRNQREANKKNVSFQSKTEKTKNIKK